VLKPNEAVKGFGSPALITLMGMFTISDGLIHSGGLDHLRAHITSDAASSPRQLMDHRIQCRFSAARIQMILIVE